MKRRLIRAWCAVLFILVGWLQADEPLTTILGYNVLIGFNSASKVMETAELIRTFNPDVILFQEIAMQDSDGLARLARLWGHSYASVAKPYTNYSIGLTSRYPFSMVERRTVGLHHGYVIAKIGDVYFMSIHLSPFDYAVRIREAAEYVKRIQPLLAAGCKIIMMGDFNNISPLDKEKFEADINALPPDQAQQRRKTKIGYRQMTEQGYEVTAIQKLMDAGLVDSGYVCMKELGIHYSWRIDLAMLSPAMMKDLAVSYVDYPHSRYLRTLSDHYPNILKFRTMDLKAATAGMVVMPQAKAAPHAAAVDKGNLIVNGSFADGSRGWTGEIRKPEQGSVTVDHGIARISRTKGSTFGRIYQDVKNLQGNTAYTLTFRDNCGKGALVNTLMIFKGPDGVWREKTRLAYHKAWDVDTWQPGCYTFTTPADVVEMRLDFRLDSIGSREIDDVVLRLATPEEIAAQTTPPEMRDSTQVLLDMAVTEGDIVSLDVTVPPLAKPDVAKVFFLNAAGSMIVNSEIRFTVQPSAAEQHLTEPFLIPPGAVRLKAVLLSSGEAAGK